MIRMASWSMDAPLKPESIKTEPRGRVVTELGTAWKIVSTSAVAQFDRSIRSPTKLTAAAISTLESPRLVLQAPDNTLTPDRQQLVFPGAPATGRLTGKQEVIRPGRKLVLPFYQRWMGTIGKIRISPLQNLLVKWRSQSSQTGCGFDLSTVCLVNPLGLKKTVETLPRCSTHDA
jgi:hypothetical protein